MSISSSSVNINYNTIAPEDYIWNRNDINTVISTASLGSSGSSTSLTQDFKNQISEFIANSDSNFLPRTGGNLTGALTLDQGVYFSDRSYQSSAFTSQQSNDLASIKDNTQFISKSGSIANNDNRTIVAGELQCDKLIIPASSLTIAKITGLQNAIDTVTSQITAIQDVNTTQSANITTNTNSINSINILNGTQTTNITSNTNSINNITNTLLPLKQNVISSTNKLSSDYISTGATTLTNKLSSIDASLSNIATNKQDLINNTTNKLPISYVDISSSALRFVDISGSLASDLTNLSNTNTSQNTRLNTIETALPNINDAITGLQGDMNTNTNSITNLTAVVEDHTTDLSEFGTLLTNHDNSIQSLETTVASHGTTIQSHDATLNTYGNTISSHSTSISNLQNSDITLQSNIDLKQDAITVSNKLSMSVVGNGDITNNELSVLSGVLTDRTLQYQINQISDAISNLDGLQDLDITSINNINTSITSISSRLNTLESVDSTQSTFNSNTTTALNTINSAISSIQSIDSLQASSISSLTASVTSLDSNKQNVIDDNAPLSSVYIQTGLDSRLDDDLIAINQSILTLNSGKQDIIDSSHKLTSSLIDYSASALRFIDISTNLQEQLTALENTDISLGNSISSIESDLLSTQLDVSALQTSVSTLQTSVNEIPVIQDELVTLQNNIDTKQNIIDINHTIPYTYVSFSGSDLVHVDVTSSLNTSLNNLANDISGINTTITGINTSISNLQSADIIHDNAIVSIESDITDLRNSKQPLIDSSNKLSSLLVTTGSETLSSKLSSVDTAINSKQDVIDNSHKLSSSLVDYSASALRFVDISSNLQQQLTTMTGAISTLQNLQNGDIQTFHDIQTNFDTLDIAVAGKVDKSGSTMTGDLVFGTGAKIKYNSGNAGQLLTSDNQGNLSLQDPPSSSGPSYPSVSYDSNSTTTTITDTTKLTSLKFSGDSSIQTTAFTSAKDSSLSSALTDISALQSDNTTNISNISSLQSDVSSLTSTVSGKQNVINSSNKLASSNVDYSSSALQYVDSGITQNLSTSLSGLSSSISALQSSDTTQTNNISTLSSSVATLQSGKQDLISSTNKISSLNVSYGVSSNVSSTLDSINTSLSGKANLTGATFSGDITAPNFIGNISSSTNATNATNATNIGVTLDTTTNSTHYVPFVGATTGNNASKVSTGLTYNPNTQTLTALNFNGNATTSSGTSQIAVADINTNTTNYITFVTNANNVAQTLRMDNSVTPLTYNPFTSTLSLGALKYASGSAGQVPISDGTGLLTLGTPSSSITYVSGTFVGTVGGNVPITSGTAFNAGNIVLTAGTWIIFVNLQFGQPSGNINTINVRTGLSNTGAYGGLIYYQDSPYIPVSGSSAPSYPPLTTVVSPTGSTTYTLFINMTWTQVSAPTFTYESQKRSFVAIKLA